MPEEALRLVEPRDLGLGDGHSQLGEVRHLPEGGGDAALGHIVHRVHFGNAGGDPRFRDDAEAGVLHEPEASLPEVLAELAGHLFAPGGRQHRGGLDGDALGDQQHVALPGAAAGLDALRRGDPDHRPRHHDPGDRGGDLGVPAGGDRAHFAAGGGHFAGQLPEPDFVGARRGEERGEEPPGLAAGRRHIVRVHDHRVPPGLGGGEGDRVRGQDDPLRVPDGGDSGVLAVRRAEFEPAPVGPRQPGEPFQDGVEDPRRRLPFREFPGAVRRHRRQDSRGRR